MCYCWRSHEDKDKEIEMVNINSIVDLGKLKLLSDHVFCPSCNKRNAYTFVSGDGITANIRLRNLEDPGPIRNPEIVPF